MRVEGCFAALEKGGCADSLILQLQHVGVVGPAFIGLDSSLTFSRCWFLPTLLPSIRAGFGWSTLFQGQVGIFSLPLYWRAGVHLPCTDCLECRTIVWNADCLECRTSENQACSWLRRWKGLSRMVLGLQGPGLRAGNGDFSLAAFWVRFPYCKLWGFRCWSLPAAANSAGLLTQSQVRANVLPRGTV